MSLYVIEHFVIRSQKHQKINATACSKTTQRILKSWPSIVEIFFTRYFILIKVIIFLIVLKIRLWYFEFYFYNNI